VHEVLVKVVQRLRYPVVDGEEKKDVAADAILNKALGVGMEHAVACGRCGRWTGWSVETPELDLEVSVGLDYDGMCVSEGLRKLVAICEVGVGDRRDWMGLNCGVVTGWSRCVREVQKYDKLKELRDGAKNIIGYGGLQSSWERVRGTAAFGMRFVRLPPVLIVRLGRFSGVGVRNNNSVGVDAELELDEWRRGDGVSPVYTPVAVKYRAVLVVMHSGGALRQGHYTVLRKGLDESWYYIDDMALVGEEYMCWVEGLADARVGSGAYLVVYERMPVDAGGVDGRALPLVRGPAMPSLFGEEDGEEEDDPVEVAKLELSTVVGGRGDREEEAELARVLAATELE